jgi:uncharacterized protein with FMN-binding domain
MTIKLKSVDKNLNSVLDLNDDSSEYKRIIEDVAYLDNSSEVSKDPQEKKTDDIEDRFYSLIDPYLRGIGLSVHSGPSYRARENKFDTLCDGIKLLTERTKYMDGFWPNLTFQLNPGNLSVSSTLKRDGIDYLKVLQDILPERFPQKQADGIKNPIIKMVGNGDMQIASIEKIQPIMKESKMIVRKLGTIEDLKELVDLKSDRKKYFSKLHEKLGVEF